MRVYLSGEEVKVAVVAYYKLKHGITLDVTKLEFVDEDDEDVDESAVGLSLGDQQLALTPIEPDAETPTGP